MTSVRVSGLGQRRLMLIATLLVAAFALFFPARQLIQQRQELVSLEDRLAALRAENQRLEQQINRLTDSEELEVLARERLGLVRPGERAYFVEPTEAPRTDVASTSEPSLFSRFWTWLGSLLRGKH